MGYGKLRKDVCTGNLGYVCNTTTGLNLIFKDGDPFNSSRSNLVTFCNDCAANYNVLRDVLRDVRTGCTV